MKRLAIALTLLLSSCAAQNTVSVPRNPSYDIAMAYDQTPYFDCFNVERDELFDSLLEFAGECYQAYGGESVIVVERCALGMFNARYKESFASDLPSTLHGECVAVGLKGERFARLYPVE